MSLRRDEAMRLPRWLRGIGQLRVGFYSTPSRQVHVRENNTLLGTYYGAVFYENGRHIHTIGMETYDQERIDKLRDAWERHGTFVR